MAGILHDHAKKFMATMQARPFDVAAASDKITVLSDEATKDIVKLMRELKIIAP